MAKKLTILLLLLFGMFMIVRQQPNLLAAPSGQSAAATPAPTEEPLEEPTAEPAEEPTAEPVEEAAEPAAEEAAAEPTLADLAAQVAALQAQVDALSAGAGLANEVTTAIYLLDTAGLHGLDERLNGEGVIESSDAGTVARVARLLSSVNWPTELATSAISVTNTLNELGVALGDDDVETAAPLATLAHESAHELSHAAEHWLGEATVAGGHDAPGQAFRVTSAVYLLDTAGLHGLDERLNGEGVIESSDAGTAERLARLLSSVDWPEALAADAANVTDLLNQFAAALSDDDVETAAPLATQVHESAHDLSHNATSWLSGTADEHDDEAASDEVDGEDHGEEGEEGEESVESGG